ncbi:MAG TPA: hypothetical protein VF970_11860, partial [Gemmatimonadales bacterium]
GGQQIDLLTPVSVAGNVTMNDNNGDFPLTIMGVGDLVVTGSITTTTSGAGVDILNTAVRLGGALSLDIGTTYQADTTEFTGVGQVIPVGAPYTYESLVVSGTAAVAGSLVLPGGLTTRGAGQLDVGGFDVTVATDVGAQGSGVTGTVGRVIMNGGAGGLLEGTVHHLDVTLPDGQTVSLSDSLHATGNLSLRGGTLALSGNSALIDGQLLFNAAFGDTASLNFGSPNGVSTVLSALGGLDASGAMFLSMHESLDTLIVGSGAGWYGNVPSDTALTGGVLVFLSDFDEDGGPGFRASTTGDATVIMAGASTTMWLANAAVRVRHLRATGDSVVFGNSGNTIYGNLTVGSGGLFDAGSADTVIGDLTTEGTGRLRMDGGTLTVNGSTTFGGGSTVGRLTGGTLQVGGDFSQSGTETFAAAAGHIVSLIGPTSQSVSFGDPTTSRFGDLTIAQPGTPAGITLSSEVNIEGSLTMSGGPGGMQTVFGNGNILRVGGLAVDTARLNNALLIWTDTGTFTGSFTQFHHVDLDGYGAAATQFSVAHAGAATPFVFDRVQFLTTPTTGRYVSAQDLVTDPNILTITMQNSTPGDGTAFEQELGGAVINWTAPANLNAWLTATSGLWSIGSNWSQGSAPTLGDSVIINLPGTYTVTFDQNNVQVGAVTVGGASGTQTLEITSADTLIIVGDLDLNPNGVMAVRTGAMVQHRGHSEIDGTVSIDDGGKSQYQGGGTRDGTHILNPGSSVTGQGTFSVNSATLVDVRGTYDVDSTLQLNGTFEFNGADTAFTARGAYLGGGFFQGSGIFAVRDSFSTNTGNVEGTGKIVVLPGAKLNFNSPLRTRSIDVRGTLIQPDAVLSIETGAAINVLSGGVFDIQADGDLFGSVAEVLTNAGTIQKSGGTGTFAIRNALINNGTVDIQSGTLDLQILTHNSGAVIQGTGTASLSATPANRVLSGTFAPGTSPGILGISGTFDPTATGVLNIELGGTTVGTQYDQLAVTGAATLTNATLNVTLINGFTLTSGQTFTVLTTTGLINGTFATENLPPGVTATYNANSVVLVVP